MSTLISGGTLVNGGVLSGTYYGATVTNSDVTVTNCNIISGTGNQSNGISINGPKATINNKISGTISTAAIDFQDGGFLSNASTGRITGDVVRITGAAGSVINAGQIAGGTTHGAVYLNDGGKVANSGTINGGGTDDYLRWPHYRQPVFAHRLGRTDEFGPLLSA
jgi:hypothetical protein